MGFIFVSFVLVCSVLVSHSAVDGLRVKSLRLEPAIVDNVVDWNDVIEERDVHPILMSWSSLSFDKLDLPKQPVAAEQTVCDETCGISDSDDSMEEQLYSNRIIEGSPTKPNEYPWMVELIITAPDYFKTKVYRCGASLIKKGYLLTAAHCVYFPKMTSIQAMLGFHVLDVSKFPENRTGYEKVVPVSRAFIHDEFNPTTMEHDIAILELAKPVEFSEKIHAICLPDERIAKNMEAGKKAVVAGWGQTKAFGTYFVPQMLLSTTVPIVDLNECQRIPHFMKHSITKNSLCAGGFGPDACVGDSGGPLMLADVSQSNVTRFSEIGIVSWGIGCGAVAGTPGVYTRVSNYISWIQQITANDPCLPFQPPSSL